MKKFFTKHRRRFAHSLSGFAPFYVLAGFFGAPFYRKALFKILSEMDAKQNLAILSGLNLKER